MKNNSGIISLSLPFAAGVAAAALLAEPFRTALGASAAAIILLIYCFFHKGNIALFPLYFCLGALCWSSGALCPAPTFPKLAAASKMAELLERIPFAGEHSGAIIQALLTGDRSGLTRDTINAFRRSGASHILALSGLHLGVIYTCLSKVLTPLGNSTAARWLKSGTIIIICSVYAAATGASASITRALIYICIGEAGRAMSWRRHSPLGTFCLALTLQLLLKPTVISTPGFQLSYLAMLGITLLFPRMESWYPKTGKRDPMRTIWKSTALTISCQVFTAPAAWYHFYSFPLYFLISNLIALPLTELVIISALASAVLEATTGCPAILSTACGKLVQLLEFCLETIASLPAPWEDGALHQLPG